FEFEGAIAIAKRPYGFFGNPLFASGVTSVHVSPPSLDRNNPLDEGLSGPSPPERYSQPLRRKSHMHANIICGFAGSMATCVRPGKRCPLFNTSFPVCPPSFVLKGPRPAKSLQSAPDTAAKTVSLLFGLTATRAMRSDFSKPAFVQVSPASVD